MLSLISTYLAVSILRTKPATALSSPKHPRNIPCPTRQIFVNQTYNLYIDYIVYAYLYTNIYTSSHPQYNFHQYKACCICLEYINAFFKYPLVQPRACGIVLLYLWQ